MPNNKGSFLLGLILGWGLGWVVPRIPYAMIGMALVIGWVARGWWG